MNPVPITKAQCILIQATVNITIEDEINNFLQKKTLNTFEHEVLEVLRLYQRVKLEQLEFKQKFKLGVSIVINSIEKAIEFVRVKIGDTKVILKVIQDWMTWIKMNSMMKERIRQARLVDKHPLNLQA